MPPLRLLSARQRGLPAVPAHHRGGNASRLARRKRGCHGAMCPKPPWLPRRVHRGRRPPSPAPASLSRGGRRGPSPPRGAGPCSGAGRVSTRPSCVGRRAGPSLGAGAPRKRRAKPGSRQPRPPRGPRLFPRTCPQWTSRAPRRPAVCGRWGRERRRSCRCCAAGAGGLAAHVASASCSARPGLPRDAAVPPGPVSAQHTLKQTPALGHVRGRGPRSHAWAGRNRRAPRRPWGAWRAGGDPSAKDGPGPVLVSLSLADQSGRHGRGAYCWRRRFSVLVSPGRPGWPPRRAVLSLRSLPGARPGPVFLLGRPCPRCGRRTHSAPSPCFSGRGGPWPAAPRAEVTGPPWGLGALAPHPGTGRRG